MPAKKVSQAERICRAFKAAQMAKGYTQKDVAKRLNVEQATVSRWYNSPYDMSVKNFCLLCQVLAINPQTIIGDYAAIMSQTK